MIQLSVPEVRKLLLQVVWHRILDENQSLAWSRWRRRHQFHAKYHHYIRAKKQDSELQL